MKSVARAALMGALLSGCVEALQVPPEGTPFIAVYSGNGVFSGFVEKTVYADDRVAIVSSEAGGKNQNRTIAQGRPGLFADVAALVAAEAPRVRIIAPGDDHLCLDYGQDRVTANPPIAGMATISASCPEPAMLAFTQRVLDAIAAP